MNPELASVLLGATTDDLKTFHDSKDQTEHPHSNAQASCDFEIANDNVHNGFITESLGRRRTEDLSDEMLLAQVSNGDQQALGVLFRRYARIVRAVAYRILRNASEADDLLQEVFLFIFRKANLFDAARGSARSWIIQVTYHRAIDRRRYLVTRHFYTVQDLENVSARMSEPHTEIAFYEQSIEGTLGKELLRKIDESLTEDQRKTIRLYFFEGYTLEELAELFGETLGNVRNHYYRGLEKMRKLIFAGKV